MLRSTSGLLSRALIDSVFELDRFREVQAREFVSDLVQHLGRSRTQQGFGDLTCGTPVEVLITGLCPKQQEEQSGSAVWVGPCELSR